MPDLKQLEHLLTRGKISRREFMARVSALGLMAALSPALLAKSAKAAGSPVSSPTASPESGSVPLFNVSSRILGRFR